MLDAIVVVGGGLTGAMKYIKPSLLRTMRENILTISGETLPRVQMRVFDLDEEGDFSTFVMGDSREIKIYGSDRTVVYDPMKRTGVAVSRIGASKAISIGAYNYALTQLDAI